MVEDPVSNSTVDPRGPAGGVRESVHSSAWFSFGPLLALALIALSIYRALTQSITHDESLTYLLFARSGPSAISGGYMANHHVLHTWLVWLSVRTFGLSVLTVRLPAVIGGVAYLLLGERLTARLVPGPAARAIAAAALLLHPYVLDFCSAARGYGIGLAFVLASMHLALSHCRSGGTARGDRLRSSLIGIFLGLAAAAVPTFLAAGAAIAIAVAMIDRGRGTRGAIKNVLSRLASILAWIAGIAASFLWAPLSHNTKSLEGVIHAASAVESIDGVVRAMLDHRGIIAPWFVGELLPRFAVGFRPIFIAGFAVFSVIAAFGTWRSRRSECVASGGLALMTSLPPLLLLMHTGAVVILGLPWPAPRTLVDLSALWLIAWIAIAGALAGSKHILLRCGHAAATAGLLLLSVAFLLQVKTGEFRDWRYDRSSRAVSIELRRVLQAEAKDGKVPTAWTMPMYWPSLIFYRTMDGTDEAIETSWERAPDRPYDAYLITGEMSAYYPDVAKYLETHVRFPGIDAVIALPRQR